MPSITASGPAITTASRLRVVAAPTTGAPTRLPTTTRWLITAAAAAAVALSGLTVLLNAVEASEAAEYAAARPVASAPAVDAAAQSPR
jgi:hypothetical protein